MERGIRNLSTLIPSKGSTLPRKPSMVFNNRVDLINWHRLLDFEMSKFPWTLFMDKIICSIGFFIKWLVLMKLRVPVYNQNRISSKSLLISKFQTDLDTDHSSWVLYFFERFSQMLNMYILILRCHSLASSTSYCHYKMKGLYIWLPVFKHLYNIAVVLVDSLIIEMFDYKN